MTTRGEARAIRFGSRALKLKAVSSRRVLSAALPLAARRLGFGGGSSPRARARGAGVERGTIRAREPTSRASRTRAERSADHRARSRGRRSNARSANASGQVTVIRSSEQLKGVAVEC